MSDNDFYMILPSNSCPTTQPNNTASLFIVDWETPFKLVGKWKVALTEFSFINTPNKLEQNAAISNVIYKNKTDNMTLYYYPANNKLECIIPNPDNRVIKGAIMGKDGKIVLMSEMIPYQVTFPSLKVANEFGFSKDNYNSNVSEIIAENKPTYKVDSNTSSYQVTIHRKFSQIERSFEKIKLKKYLLFPEEDELVEYIRTTCIRILKDVSLDEDGIVNIALARDINEIELDKYVADVLGFNMTTLKDKRNFKGDRKPKLLSSFSQMYVYSSIVSPILVGGILVPLVKCLWVENKYNSGDPFNEVIDSPMYIPLASSSINNIEINIRDDSGKLIEFHHGSKSSVTLHFQKND